MTTTSVCFKTLEGCNISGDFILENRMYGVYGINPDTGFSVDIYTNALRNELVLSKTGFVNVKDSKGAVKSFASFKRSMNGREMSMSALDTFLDSLK